MATELHVATHNLRLDLEVDGKHRFWQRFAHLPAYWAGMNCDIFGFQEVTPPMMERIKQAMPDYRLVGQSRSAGAEACPIAFRRDMFGLLEEKTVWLTDTPDQPSKDQESKYPRIATIVRLVTKDKTVVQVVNVHLDYASVNVALRQIAAAVRSFDVKTPTVLMGDLNFTKDSLPCVHLEQLGMENAIRRFALQGATFHGFSDRLDGEPIDHVFVSPGIKIAEARIDRSRPSEGYYSDHDPVVARLIWTT